MQRRPFITLALAVLLAPALHAHADSVLPPPPPLDVAARPTVHTGRSGGPASASWTLRNTGSSPMHVRVGRAICLLDGMRLPLRVVGATVDGREAREFDVAPGGSATLEVRLDGFTEPASREHEWTIDLSLEVRGGGSHSGHAQGTTTVRRIALPG